MTNNINKNSFSICIKAFLALLLAFCFSCKKFVQIDPPINQITTPTVFSDEKTATAAVTGLYSIFLNNSPDIFDSRITTVTSLSSDDMVRTGPNPFEDAFYKNALANNNVYINMLWSSNYKYIYQANAIIEGLSKSTNLRDSVKIQLSAEAKFVRAFVYFYLTNMFGDVPLITTTDYAENAALSRTAVSTVYDQIVSDLKDAQSNLTSNYPTSERIRPNRLVATALLARVYLYKKDYSNAEAQATTVITSGKYSLQSDVNKVFLANSSEAIWQLKPVDPNIRFRNTSEGQFYLPASATSKPTYILTPWLLNAFEIGDVRLTGWTKTNIVSGVSYVYPNKYKFRTGNTYSEYIMVLRLAEQYLIRAEARAQQNNISGAQSDLNTIRTRAGLPNTTASSQSTLLSAIEHERQTELFIEFGHRWFDLKRTGRVDAVLGSEKTGWKSTAALYPLPIYDLNTNSNLVQNPSY